MSGGRALHLARFSVRTNLRASITRGGIGAGLAVLLLGPALAWQAGRGWGFDPELGFFGLLIAALFTLRSGLEEQRAAGLDAFLRQNLASPVEHAMGAVWTLAATWILFLAGAFMALLAASGGDIGLAGWHTAAWGLRVLLLLGFVPWVESWATLRIPLLLPALLYFGLVLVLTVVLGEERAIALFVPTDRSRPDTLLRLAAHAFGAFGLSTGLFLVATGVRGRRHRAASGSGAPWRNVPSRHGSAPAEP